MTKHPKTAFIPKAGKAARAVAPASTDGLRLSWHFRGMDIDGPYCPTRMVRATMLEVRKKLVEFESMTWAELYRSGSHPIPVEELDPAAQKRLVAIGEDDADQVVSLRLGGKPRIFGIREGRY